MQHGLIAATSDQTVPEIGIRWYNGFNTYTGAIGEVIGTGLANTNAIISSQGETSTNYAAGLARAYKGGGYTDWYLPSLYELDKLYTNKTVIDNFAEGSYWSSTELDSGSAWFQEFSSYLYPGNKSNAFYVRAIRAF